MENEKIFYQDEHVLITQSRFVSHGKTYAMRNVASASVTRNSKSYLKITSGIMLVFGLSSLYTEDYWLGVAALGISVILLLNSRDEYFLVISSNSGASNALRSTNQEYVQTILDAINKAIIYRG